MKKTITLILLAAMLTSLAACGGDAGGSTDTTKSDVTTEPVTTEPELTDNLPEKDMEGFELGIYIPSPDGLGWALRMVDAPEANGDVLNDEVYDRNRAVEERFNCKIFELQHKGTAISGFKNAVMAGDSSYKLGQIYDSNVGGLITAGVLTPWDDVPYVDLDADWWNQSAADTYTVNGKIYGAVGDYNLSEYSKAYMLYFNKTIYDEIKQDKSLYDYVIEDKWTLDTFTTIAKQYAQDLDGDTAMGENDQWGFVGTAKVAMQMLISGAGVRFIEPNDDGDPHFAIPGNQSAVDKMQKILEAFKGSEDWYSQLDNPMGGMNDQKFIDGKTLFQAASIWNTDTYREVEFDIGMLPAPKLDENQENYYCITAGGHIAVVPKSLSEEELENVGILTEALSFAGRKTTLPVYKETVLKGKYARDEESLTMIDIIFDSASFDAGVLLWGDVRQQYVSGPFFKFDDTIASTTEAIRSKVEGAIQTTIDAVTNAG